MTPQPGENMVADTYPEYYLIGVQLFCSGDYFEAHEAWEWHWKNTPGPERSFFQGLIQIAVALCHFCNGNMHGARKLYFSGRAYLEPFRPRRFGLDVERFLGEAQRCFEDVIDPARVGIVPFDAKLAPTMPLDPAPMALPDIPKWITEDGEPPDDD